MKATDNENAKVLVSRNFAGGKVVRAASAFQIKGTASRAFTVVPLAKKTIEVVIPRTLQERKARLHTLTGQLGTKDPAPVMKVEDPKDEVIRRLQMRLTSKDAAEKWYRSYHIPSFGGKTAAQLVRRGRARSVLRFIESIDAGVHA